MEWNGKYVCRDVLQSKSRKDEQEPAAFDGRFLWSRWKHLLLRFVPSQVS